MIQKTILKAIMAILCLIGSFLPASAAEHYGREIWYEALTPQLWKVYVRTYEDCEAGVNAPINVASAPVAPTGVATPSWGQCGTPVSLANPLLESWTEVTALCPSVASSCTDPLSTTMGVMEYVYSYELDPSGFICNFNIVVDGCCRPVDLTNGGASENTSISLDSYLDPIQIGVNHAPIPRNPQYLTGCATTGGVFDLSAIDPDGDDLNYHLVYAYTSWPTNIATYSTGYNGWTPLGPNWNVSLDWTTGILTVLPNGTGTPEKATIVVNITEDSDTDSTVTVVRREIIVDMQACSPGNAIPTFGSLTSTNAVAVIGDSTIEAISGTQLSFDLEMLDPGDTPKLVESMLVDLPGATVTHSGSGPVTANVVWDIPQFDSDTLIPVYVTIEDGNCPYPSRNAKVIYLDIQAWGDAVVTPTTCTANTGAIDLTVNFPYSSLVWSNGATTEDLSGLASGPYTVQYFDASGGLILSQTYFVSSTDLSFSTTLTQPSCGLSDGQISLAISGGTAPYTVSWSNGGTGLSQTGLSAGTYVIQVTDAAGCFALDQIELDPQALACQNVIEGKVYVDMNANCLFDAGDAAIPHAMVYANGKHAVSDAQGNYQLVVGSGTYSIQLISSFVGSINAICLPSGTHSATFAGVGSSATGLDFPIEADSAFDVSIDQQAYTPPVPGLGVIFNLLVQTQNYPVSGVVATWIHDDAFDVTSFNPPATSYDPVTRTATWNLGNLAPQQSIMLKAYTEVDTLATIGDSVFNQASVVPVIGDMVPGNNQDDYAAEILGAYDPNDKQSKEGEGPLGYIQQSERDLTYTIRFQNTGNFPAIRVILRDTLESNLPIESLYVKNYSHDFTMRVEDGNILVFTFSDIWLPDSLSDPMGSIGFIKFGMKHSGALDYGTQLRNDAGIYFDFNEPIFTNEAVNTIASPTALPDPNWNHVRIAPNPFSESTRITFDNPDMKLNSLILWDMQGRVVKRLPLTRADYFDLDRGNLSEGVYLFELRGETSYFGKVVIE
ncbi:hypothetical protein [Pontibacter sp. G13]|uniref:DUF7619 domain-containing protein n=1 Tax=Pontibacter sp. G13 TaxID=3074898 RepID=UPI00288AC1DB|nr:hypothetical protein [Pontibacter sp. G13]WNJ19710.1 hypothetical protein RJD25_04440 [Pontibacter sp. G13]